MRGSGEISCAPSNFPGTYMHDSYIPPTHLQYSTGCLVQENQKRDLVSGLSLRGHRLLPATHTRCWAKATAVMYSPTPRMLIGPIRYVHARCICMYLDTYRHTCQHAFLDLLDA